MPKKPNNKKTGNTQAIYHIGLFAKQIYMLPVPAQLDIAKAWDETMSSKKPDHLVGKLAHYGIAGAVRIVDAVLKHHNLMLFGYWYLKNNVQDSNTVQAASASSIDPNSIGYNCTAFQGHDISRLTSYNDVANQLNANGYGALVARMQQVFNSHPGMDVQQPFAYYANDINYQDQLCSPVGIGYEGSGPGAASLSNIGHEMLSQANSFFNNMSSFSLDDIASSLNNAATAAYGAFAAAAVVAYVGKSVVEVYNGLTGFGAVSIKEAVTVRVKTVAEPLKQIAAGYMHKPLGLSLKSA